MLERVLPEVDSPLCKKKDFAVKFFIWAIFIAEAIFSGQMKDGRKERNKLSDVIKFTEKHC